LQVTAFCLTSPPSFRRYVYLRGKNPLYPITWFKIGRLVKGLFFIFTNSLASPPPNKETFSPFLLSKFSLFQSSFKPRNPPCRNLVQSEQNAGFSPLSPLPTGVSPFPAPRSTVQIRFSLPAFPRSFSLLLTTFFCSAVNIFNIYRVSPKTNGPSYFASS